MSMAMIRMTVVIRSHGHPTMASRNGADLTASPNLGHDPLRRRDVLLGVNLGHSQRLVTENHLRRLEPVFLPKPRRRVVPELVRVPRVCCPPVGPRLLSCRLRFVRVRRT